MKKSRSRVGMSLLCTAALVFSTGVFADTDTTESLRVSYVSSDLATPEGAQKLYLHIQQAARVVCHESANRELFTFCHRCFEHAVNDAVASVGSSTLTAIHLGNGHTQRIAHEAGRSG
jgi:UrcA family protein